MQTKVAHRVTGPTAGKIKLDGCYLSKELLIAVQLVTEELLLGRSVVA
jgi:hypothetical protein